MVWNVGCTYEVLWIEIVVDRGSKIKKRQIDEGPPH